MPNKSLAPLFLVVAALCLTAPLGAQEAAVFLQLGHSFEVNSAAFSPDGRRIVSASWWDKTIKIWNAE